MKMSGKAENKHIAIPDLRKIYPRKILSHGTQGDIHEFSLRPFP